MDCLNPQKSPLKFMDAICPYCTLQGYQRPVFHAENQTLRAARYTVFE